MTSVCIIAGEPSGDFLGGQLAKALKTAQPDVVLSGVGGAHMKAAGIDSLFAYEDLAVMGIAEVLPNLRTILRRIRETADFILETRPDIVVTIDSPDFVFRVIKAVKKKTDAPPKFVHYVAPSVWAWRAGRAEKISKIVDGLICLFDFEPPYFERYGLKTVAAGHPLVEGGAMEASGPAFREEYAIANSDPIVGVLFGSRKGELKRVGKDLRDAAFQVAERLGPNTHIVAPTLPHVKDAVFDLLKDYSGPIHIVDDPAHKWNAFASMEVALAVSGTVGLELAAMRVPHIIAYKASPLTFLLIKHLVKVKFAHLANIMEGAEVVPEFLQSDCKPDDMAEIAYRLHQSPAKQIGDFDHIRFRLGYGQPQTPSEKAAAFVLSFTAA